MAGLLKTSKWWPGWPSTTSKEELWIFSKTNSLATYHQHFYDVHAEEMKKKDIRKILQEEQHNIFIILYTLRRPNYCKYGICNPDVKNKCHRASWASWTPMWQTMYSSKQHTEELSWPVNPRLHTEGETDHTLCSKLYIS